MKPMPKNHTWKSKKYREWVSTLPCVVKGTPGPNAPHHVRINGNAGTGQKPSDYWCVPVRYDLHNEIHNNGSDTFEAKYGVSLMACVVDTLAKWITENA